jgi:hypothetical protein
MSQRVPIQYRGFWDVPRIFLARYQGRTFLFDCPFDEQLDDYPDTYGVFLLPDLQEEELPKDWTCLRQRAVDCLGNIPVSRVTFDPTKRQSIDSGLLDEILSVSRANGRTRP